VKAAKCDDQENVEGGETDHGTGAAADERKPLDGASGIRRGKRARGRAIFRLDVRPNHKQIHGVVHGGILAALADTTAAIGLYGDTQGDRDRYCGAKHQLPEPVPGDASRRMHACCAPEEILL